MHFHAVRSIVHYTVAKPETRFEDVQTRNQGLEIVVRVWNPYMLHSHSQCYDFRHDFAGKGVFNVLVVVLPK